MSPHGANPDLKVLRAAIERACQPAYVPFIMEGRKRVGDLPRQWVLDTIEIVGRSALNFADPEWGYWEYGRFVELLNDIGATELLRRMVREGLASTNEDIRDLAELWQGKIVM